MLCSTRKNSLSREGRLQHCDLCKQERAAYGCRLAECQIQLWAGARAKASSSLCSLQTGGGAKARAWEGTSCATLVGGSACSARMAGHGDRECHRPTGLQGSRCLEGCALPGEEMGRSLSKGGTLSLVALLPILFPHKHRFLGRKLHHEGMQSKQSLQNLSLTRHP